MKVWKKSGLTFMDDLEALKALEEEVTADVDCRCGGNTQNSN